MASRAPFCVPNLVVTAAWPWGLRPWDRSRTTSVVLTDWIVSLPK
jgi:hypothetical protein